MLDQRIWNSAVQSGVSDRLKPDSGQKSKIWVKDGKSSVKDLKKQQLWDIGPNSEKF